MPSPEGFRRELGLADAVVVVAGGIIGVGIFANPSNVARVLERPGADPRRLDHRRRGRAAGRLRVGRARIAVPRGRRAVRLPGARLPAGGRVSLRRRAAVHHQRRIAGGGGDAVCDLRGRHVRPRRPDRHPDRRRRRAAGADRRQCHRRAGREVDQQHADGGQGRRHPRAGRAWRSAAGRRRPATSRRRRRLRGRGSACC